MALPFSTRSAQIGIQKHFPVIEFEPLLDAIEAAALLRMHPKTLKKKARLGEIPGRHVGKYWRFRVSDLNGNNLAPIDLKIIELAINHGLNEKGLVRFDELYRSATKPDGYTAPYLFGIEHLTIDHHGNVLWKGAAVEIFHHDIWRQPGWRDQMRPDAEAVAARCRQLEAEGIEPSMATVTDW